MYSAVPGLQRLQENAEQNERNAEVEGEIDFATFAEDEEGEDYRVARFEIIGQINGKGRKAFQGLNL